MLAFDFGTRRIGVAIGNTFSRAARPLRTVAATPTAGRFDRIGDLLREWQPSLLVVGRPLYPDGNRSESTGRCERFARQLAGRFGLPVVMVDERWSSAAAVGQDEADLDARAAAVILQQFFDDPQPVASHGATHAPAHTAVAPQRCPGAARTSSRTGTDE